MIDNFWNMLDMTLLKNIWEAIKEGVIQIKDYLINKDSDEFNWVRINYTAGFTMSFIGTFFIPFADIAKISEVGKIGEVLAKINSEIGKTISQTAKFVKIQTAEAYQKVNKALEDLILIFKTGGQKLKDFIKNLWRKIADWFLKNKKMLLYEGAGNEIRTTLAKVVDIANDLAPVEILEYEKKIFGFTHEYAGIRKATGELIKDISSGKRKEVNLKKYTEHLIGATVTHNHPAGSSLSTGDIRNFLLNSMQELRAVASTDRSVFVLRYTGEKLTFREISVIQKEIAKILLPKGIPVDYNSLDVADLWIEKLLEHYGNRVEYIHYKKL
ncbi:hypothetical protein [Chryseobacterium camelliae]|uniref:hypothetical protein n=1 Tax=Chryseobacterium camelliae TaxID=1265445 RepID=UPI000C1CBA16|nr:hypothetical protein [Chryseobacterium camelliae]